MTSNLPLDQITFCIKTIHRPWACHRLVESLRKEYIDDSGKFEEKLEAMRCKEIKALLFDEYLRVTNNEKEGVQSLTKFFIKK